MKGTALKTFRGQHGRFRKGDPIDNVPDHYLRQLEAGGLAIILPGAAPAPRASAKKRPTKASSTPGTGRTGGGKQPSSSAAGRAPKKPASKKAGDAPAS